MKKPLLIIILMAAGYQLKAQQLFPVKPADSLANGLLNPSTVKPNMSFKLFQPKSNLLQPLQILAFNKTERNIDRMPVAVLSGNSKMPVVKLGGYYTMPVVKTSTEEVPLIIKPGLPGLPTFSKP
jgi:hypothetical protein